VFWWPPSKKTTPGEWKVIGCVVVPLFVILGVTLLIYGKVAGDDSMVVASAYILGMAFVAGILAFLRSRFM
jgi:hypothetical protein